MLPAPRTRRKFISDSAKLLVTVCSLSSLSNACDPEGSKKRQQLSHLEMDNGHIILDLSKSEYGNLHFVGKGVKVKLGPSVKPLIVTRVSTTEVAAFSSQCTHAGSEIFLPEQGKLVCKSGHGAVFDLRGNVLSGPATSSLDQFDATIDINNNRIRIRYFS